MFDSLEEQIRKDEDRVSSGKERAMRWIIAGIGALVIFGAVVFGLKFI